jgi:hypothetical protein
MRRQARQTDGTFKLQEQEEAYSDVFSTENGALSLDNRRFLGRKPRQNSYIAWSDRDLRPGFAILLTHFPTSVDQKSAFEYPLYITWQFTWVV